MKDLGKNKILLGIEVQYNQDQRLMSLSPKIDIESLAEMYQIKENQNYRTSKDTNLKLNLIRALLYACQSNTPDMSFAANYLTNFQESYSETYFKYSLCIASPIFPSNVLSFNYVFVSPSILNILFFF